MARLDFVQLLFTYGNLGFMVTYTVLGISLHFLDFFPFFLSFSFSFSFSLPFLLSKSFKIDTLLTSMTVQFVIFRYTDER